MSERSAALEQSNAPDPVATTTAVGVATDFDTDNTYKLSPQSLVWNIQKLRLLGEIDHYCRVFWWKQSVASNPSYTQCTVTFSGNWNDQDVVWLHVGGSAIGKTVFGAQDNSNTIESAMQPRGPWLAKTGTGEQP